MLIQVFAKCFVYINKLDSNGTTKLVNIKNQDGLTKILDMVPDFLNRFMDKKDGEKEKEDTVEKAVEAVAAEMAEED